jgi:hypothetical protein
MRARIVILPDRGLTLITDEGTFAEGAERINTLLQALGAEGIQFTTINPPKQHRHDDLHAHQHVHSEASHDR